MDKHKAQLKKLRLEIQLEKWRTLRWLIAGSVVLTALIIAIKAWRGV